MTSGERYTPWWLKHLLVFGRNPPAMTHRQWMVLVLLQAAGFFSNYCDIVFRLSLPQIRKDLNMDEFATTVVTCLLPLSGVIALGMSRYADIFGRKKALTLTIIPFAVLTGLTSVVQSWQLFILVQIFAQGFIYAEEMISHVFLVEEMPDSHRGWAVGALHTGSSFGSGSAVLLFGILNGNWRLIYAAAVVPIVGVGLMRKLLPESKEFRRKSLGLVELERAEPSPAIKSTDIERAPSHVWVLQKRHSMPASAAFSPDKTDAAVVGKRHALLRKTSLLMYLYVIIDHLCDAPNKVFAFSYLQEVHHLTPSQVTWMGIYGVVVIMASFNISGRAGDIFGRVNILLCAQMLYLGAIQLFYNVSGMSTLSFLFVGKTATGKALRVLKDTISSEIFPTEFRSTAQGIIVLLCAFSQPLGLFIFANLPGNKWSKIPVMALLNLCWFPLVYQLPDTAGRSLDVINERLRDISEVIPLTLGKQVSKHSHQL